MLGDGGTFVQLHSDGPVCASLQFKVNHADVHEIKSIFIALLNFLDPNLYRKTIISLDVIHRHGWW